MSSHTASAGEITENEKSEIERRSAARYRCCLKCNVRPDGATGVAAWPGIIYDISTGGIGVVLPCELIAGTILTIDLFGGKQERRTRARVVRSTLQSFAYFHGCEFVEPLREDEVQAWLK